MSISPHGPHPWYNELDGVSRLQTHLCPNRLSGLEALCEGLGTDLLPFSRAWEVCKKSDGFALWTLMSAERGSFCSQYDADPSAHKYMELRDTTVTGSASWESVVFQRSASVIMCWLRGSCPRQREKWREEGGKYTDFNIGKTFRHLCLAKIMNNLSRSIMLDDILNSCNRYNRG